MTKFGLPVVLLLALVLRVFVAFFAGGEHKTFDSSIYIAVADSITDGNPISAFPNGYPILISMVRLLFGLDFETPLIWINILLGTATVWLTWRLGLLYTGCERFALIIAACMALFPHPLRYTQLIMTEVLATFLLALALLLLLLATEATHPAHDTDPDTKTADANVSVLPWLSFLSACVLQYGIAVRPSLGLVAPFLVVLLMLFRKPKWITGAFVVGSVLGCLLFFLLDKVHVTAAPQTLANNALISIGSDSRNVEFVQYSPEDQKTAFRTYLQFAMKQPAKFLEQRAISLWELWGPVSLPGPRAENKSLPVRFVVFCRFFLMALSLVSLWKGRRRFESWALFAPIVAITIIHVATFSNHRFIAPLEPMLFVLAGSAVRDWVRIPRERRLAAERAAASATPA